MSLVVTCSCGSKFAARPDLAGKSLACPSCGNQLTVPEPPPVVASCGCGQRFSAPAKMAGKQVACPSCRQPLTVSNQPVSSQPKASAANLTALDLTGGTSSTPSSTFVPQSPRPAPPPPSKGPSLGTIVGGIFGLIGAVVLVGCVATMYLGFFAVGGVPDVDLEKVGERYSDKRGVVKADEGEQFLLYQDLVAALTFSRPKPGTIPKGWSKRSIGRNNNASFGVPQNVTNSNGESNLVKRYISSNNTEMYTVSFTNQKISDPLTKLAIIRAEELKLDVTRNYEKRLQYQGYSAWEQEVENTAGGSTHVSRFRVIATPGGVFAMTRSGSPGRVRGDSENFFATLDIKAAEDSGGGGGEVFAGGWKTQNLNGAGVASFPAGTSVTTHEIGGSQIYEAKTSSNRNSYTVAFKAEEIEDTTFYLSAAQSNFRSQRGIRSQISNQKEMRFQGHPAWEHELNTESEEGEPIKFHSRWVATPHGLYTMTRGGVPTDVTADGARFLDSLEIANPSGE